ncbi:replication protein A 70 kDa DNA-binding subunit C [Trifolium repens]|nr:replication protein A 70 kDa DNA-binding subunit C [Trifolium repens]
MWKAPAFLNPSETNSLEMVLIDAKSGLYRTTLHPYKIVFQSKTQLTSCESCDLPDLGLSLVNIAEICAHTRDYDIAVHGIESETTVPLIGEAGKPSVEEEFLRIHPKKSIEELMNTRDSGVVGVCAEVVRIVDGNDWWFRVKLEVTDHKSTCVFVVFDSDMSYILEKWCSFFVAQSKAKTASTHSIEFESLIGHKMLFAVDVTSKVGSSLGGSYRVKRVCMDSKVIKSLCAQYPLPTPAKGISGCVDLDSDVDSISTDSTGEVQAMEFARDVIVRPPMNSVKAQNESQGPSTMKRNLSKSFDKVGEGKFKGRLKKVKVEKE